MIEFPKDPFRELQELRHANAQDRTDVQRLWKLLKRQRPMAAAPPWGINVEEEDSSSYACEGCAITASSLFVTVIRTSTGTEITEDDAVMTALEAYGPIELEIYIKYSWTAPPPNGKARLGWFTNTCIPYTWVGPPPSNTVFNRSARPALVCQWFTPPVVNPAAWQANLAIARFTDTNCTLNGAQFIESRISFSCSPLLWKYQIADMKGNVFRIEVTE